MYCRESRGSVREFGEFARGASRIGLQSVVLSRLNRIANLQKQIRELWREVARQRAELKIADARLRAARSKRCGKRARSAGQFILFPAATKIRRSSCAASARRVSENRQLKLPL